MEKKFEAGEHTATRVGVVGYGALGKYLTERVLETPGMELAFVWNRSPEAVSTSADAQIRNAHLVEMENFAERGADIIVEVAHPSITSLHGASFLRHAHYFCGSPTCFADENIERAIRSSSTTRALFLPCGALWGSRDIQKMAERGTLKGLKIRMTKAPHHFKVLGSLKEKLAQMPKEGKHVLFEGPVRDLCPLAPNNVNTMACAAMASGERLGFDKVVGVLVADSDASAHTVEIELSGPGGFEVSTRRYNPAKKGAVTGNATYDSFFSSLMAACKQVSNSRNGLRGVHIV